MSTTRFRLRRAFAAEPLVSRKTLAGVLCDEPTHRVSAAILEHGTPCLAFALREAAHVNIWKNRLSEHGLPVGPWLRSLKQAVVERRADDHLIRIVGLARNRAHLTTMAAGEIARQANVRRVEPFHFSPRYAGDEVRMLAEVMTAFRGSHA